MTSVNILVEGRTDEPVAKRLINHVGLEVRTVYGRKGKPHLLERLSSYNKAAQYAPWFVIVDLDADTQCPSEAVGIWLPNPSNRVIAFHSSSPGCGCIPSSTGIKSLPKRAHNIPTPERVTSALRGEVAPLAVSQKTY